MVARMGSRLRRAGSSRGTVRVLTFAGPAGDRVMFSLVARRVNGFWGVKTMPIFTYPPRKYSTLLSMLANETHGFIMWVLRFHMMQTWSCSPSLSHCWRGCMHRDRVDCALDRACTEWSLSRESGSGYPARIVRVSAL